ncbi:hypothetical protein F0919_17750 [Taibaiella lutea]|uniref:Uncharacterized protein n=1 Tax=Taibaiella lutea TaxID=2608001 RepID=A0A5M6CBW9_9BACT|nr:hypothetical protein [Taibaiella lutea]KAA5532626.1 hypothetical protein F0919_17750 [Taibaiella lutea]
MSSKQNLISVRFQGMEFLAIPIMINGNVQYFDFRYSEKDKYDQAWHITSLDKETVLEEDFTVIKTNMPDFWLKPMIDRLKDMLENNDFNP